MRKSILTSCVLLEIPVWFVEFVTSPGLWRADLWLNDFDINKQPRITRDLLFNGASFTSLGVCLFFEYHHKFPVLLLCSSINQSINRIPGLFLSTMHNLSLMMTYTWFWGYFILINVVEINGANVRRIEQFGQLKFTSSINYSSIIPNDITTALHAKRLNPIS